MTREEALEKAQIIDFQGGYTIALVVEIYNDIVNHLKAQSNNERRDFRDRCIFREILEHIGVSDDL